MDQAEVSRWARATELLDQILELPPGQQQQAVTGFGTAHGVLGELRLLLRGSHQTSVLDQSLEDSLTQLPEWKALDVNALKGKVIGHWVLGDEIGRGGMSIVYHATRVSDEFTQHAALKILSVAHLGENFVEGFLRERQILSDLHHPGIARLIDGGLTAEGAPYLVMQCVNGERIDRWCKANGDDLQTIARLMVKLCHAVAYAQRHLVVHQDINPSNVLVDEHRQPVLIDFGIARLLEDSSAEQALHAFTKHYAAPEQKAGGLITTATDVYALGKLFQVLATRQKMDRDLELVLQCATQADPEQRYANARNLANDLEAWLDKRPVQAHPPGLAYRAGRFLDRNWLGTSAAVLVLVSILGGLGISVWQARIAAKERDLAQLENARATQVTSFLKDLFRASDPDRAQGDDVSARELLDQGAHQARFAFDGNPVLKAEMLVLLGHLYLQLGETKSAASLLEEGLQLADSLADTGLRVEARKALAKVKMEEGDHATALRLAEQGEELLIQAGQVPGPKHASLMQPILFSMAEMGHAAEAVQRGEVALKAARLSEGLPVTALYDYLQSTGNVMLVAERADDAEALLAEAASMVFDAADDPTRLLALHTDLAGVLSRKGDIAGTFEHQQLALEIANRIYPPNHTARARQLSNYGSTLDRMGRHAEAEKALREALDIYSEYYGTTPHPRVAAAQNNLGRALMQAGRFDAAAPHMAMALELAGKLFGTQDPRYVIATSNLGELERRRGNLDRAEELLVQSLELRRSLLGPDHRSTGNSMALLALLRLDQGRWEEALGLSDGALALFRRIGFESPETLIATTTRRARALAGMGRIAEADSAFSEALAMGEAAGDDAGMPWLELLAARAAFLFELQDSRAQAAQQQSLEAHRQLLGMNHPITKSIEALSPE